MEEKINKLIANSLFQMTGKLTISQFKNIVKKMEWKMDYKKIQIVGTNGKGSVAKFINDNLVKDEQRVGLFTSPHIINLEERIRINNLKIPFIDLQINMMDIYIKFPEYTFGFFQLMFLSSLAYFEQKKVSVAIFESGIGAKKDIVNFLDFDITCFTSISIDHEEILGSTIEKITTDKSFAIKEKNIVYIPDNMEEKSLNIMNKRINFVNNKTTKIIKIKSKNIYDNNKEIAKTILENEFKIKPKLFLLPAGRSQEIIINNITCYIDVGHNQDGIKKTLSYFKENNIVFDNYIVSLSSNKNVKKIMNNFDPQNTFVYQNKNKRSLPIHDFPEEFGRIYSIEKLIKTLDKRILFIGSFYFIEEILREIKYEIS
ncbi:MAG: hypothetical protein KFW07_03925 [Mycoplasmataceae bacterium]|nr:hypothetical protein [Mycoplasmataceae bacterium]